MEPKDSKDSTFRTILGTDQESSEYDVNFQDCGSKHGVKYDCISINPTADTDDFDQKTLHVTYKEDNEQLGGLKYATVAISDIPNEVSGGAIVSKSVTLRDTDSDIQLQNDEAACASGSLEQQNEMEEDSQIFASDPEALKYLKFGFSGQSASITSMNPTEKETRKNTADNDIFASDSEALKFLKLESKSYSCVPKPVSGGLSSTTKPIPSQTQVFASDSEALQFMKFAPDDASNSDTEPSGQIFASDDDALNYITLIPKAQDSGPFGSDGEALKSNLSFPYVQGATASGSTVSKPPHSESTPDDAEIFVSDSDALKYIKFARKHSAEDSPGYKQPTIRPNTETNPSTPPPTPDKEAIEEFKHHDSGFAAAVESESEDSVYSKSNFGIASNDEGDFIAEKSASLGDDKNYLVRVSGHPLPNGMEKKFVCVSGQDNCALSEAEVDKLQVSVEEKVNSDGTIEKFVAIE